MSQREIIGSAPSSRAWRVLRCPGSGGHPRRQDTDQGPLAGGLACVCARGPPCSAAQRLEQASQKRVPLCRGRSLWRRPTCGTERPGSDPGASTSRQSKPPGLLLCPQGQGRGFARCPMFLGAPAHVLRGSLQNKLGFYVPSYLVERNSVMKNKQTQHHKNSLQSQREQGGWTWIQNSGSLESLLIRQGTPQALSKPASAGTVPTPTGTDA